MRYWLFTFLFALLFWNKAEGQSSSGGDSLHFTAIILDTESSETIPYAAVYNKTSGRATLSNIEGYFSLDRISLNDTLILSFIGYRKKTIIASHLNLEKQIYLIPKIELLDQVTVYADNTFLYHLVASCYKSRAKRSKTAKTYYMLKSTVNDKQVECVENYCNGHFSGYNVDHLDLKNGRIALSDFENRFFVSTESSKALYLHTLFKKNDYFPVSPFQLKKKKLKNQYDLALVSKYVGEDSNTIYIIDFTPKEGFRMAFNGRVWIDSVDNRIVKVKLQIPNSKVHPFIPHGNVDSLVQVNMNITKTYYEIENQSYVHSIDFDYLLSYRTMEGSLFTVNTNAILYAYDYTESFVLPRFNYPNGSYEDYRKINASPYNTFFWNNIDEFGMKDVQDKNNLFIQNASTLTSETLFLNNAFFGKNFFEHPYVFWSENRIKFREETTDFEDYTSTMPSERYHLEAQIYLDINDLNDSLNCITATVFDPVETFYHYPITNEGLAFINMYFDLIEIHRMEIAQELNGLNKLEQMMAIYDQKTGQLKNISRRFFQEVQRGTNSDGMLKWNDFIQRKIGIDNVALFNLYSDE